MKNDTLLYALGSAIRRLRDHKDYGLIKTIYQGLKEDGFDITKVGGSEAEQSFIHISLVDSSSQTNNMPSSTGRCSTP